MHGRVASDGHGSRILKVAVESFRCRLEAILVADIIERRECQRAQNADNGDADHRLGQREAPHAHDEMSAGQHCAYYQQAAGAVVALAPTWVIVRDVQPVSEAWDFPATAVAVSVKLEAVAEDTAIE